MKTRIGLTLRKRRLLKHVTEGNTQERIEVTGKRVKRRKKLLDGLNEKTGYWKLKEETPDRTLWRTRFGRGRKLKEWIVKHLKYKNRTVYWFLYVIFILNRYHYFIQDACLFFFNQWICISIYCEADITMSRYDQIVAVRRPAQAQYVYSDFTESGWVLSEMKDTENHHIWRTGTAFCTWQHVEAQRT